MNTKCFNCERNGQEFHGYVICDSCKKELRLFTEKTVKKHIVKFTKPVYRKEIKDRLKFIETDVIKKKLKLLDILNKLEK